MLGRSHELCTRSAFELLIAAGPESEAGIVFGKIMDSAARASREVDELADVELVDVRGIRKNSRDDPHRDEWMALDDATSHGVRGYGFTAFNHFIDIKKGPGIFDDFDGYSFYRGSASGDQHEDAMESRGGWTESIYRLLGENPKVKVDELIAWYLADNYVHVQGGEWCQGCSEAMTNYSFFGDQGRYSSVENELQARFPPADARGREGKGVPYSVFMPADNLARYHYALFTRDHNVMSLGAILHALQDVAVPHHAAGYLGNFHGRYESDLEDNISTWLSDERFIDLVSKWRAAYTAVDHDAPTKLSMSDLGRMPGKNWRVDMLVTWMALNSYRSYEEVYHGFRDGYSFNVVDAQELAGKSIALCAVVIESMFEKTGFQAFME